MIHNNETHSWRTTLVSLGATLQDAITSLEVSGLQIVLAVGPDDKLVGTLTDGDIRRAFLRGLRLENAIDEVVHRNPLVVPPEIGRDLVLRLMQANKIHQLPVVDGKGTVVGLHVWDHVLAPADLDNPMVIMAGGRGTRLRPHTESCPKPMLEVGGKPMLQHIIERAKLDGFRNFIISLHYLGEMIEQHFGDGREFGVNIDYVREDTPLGTAGCLSIIERRPELPFIVTNGDVLTDIHYSDLIEFHERHHAVATMAVRQHEIQNQFGVVRINGVEIAGFEEKPVYRSHINAGIYVLNPEVLTHLEARKHCDMPTLFERIKQHHGRTIVYPMHEPWLDVGRPDDLAQAKRNFENNEVSIK
jgi:dTDP-glucose pyrophosphorylase